ncbi:RNA polymerase subunit [Fowlpox virus]|uniref:DNA-directed RNA polymerase 30 kDa polypeptide n=2 Tax=Fowlpox virus TaxID=10261 RepID=RPO5_FOWPN|nr:RNA polymerase subunit [Fowlpox virus]Q9J5C0.1 RecName: Full=DNA-directed RNA polymerase 30 kDa polypeptide [Fowlpox virus strain NVSL]UNS14302.1 ALPV-138 [Albatrosspox virus]WPD90947.1 RNA polymerase subunit RPO30 [Avipoxvirus sp.]CAE52641.1 RNA polymerase subunit RPO30 E4L orthologue [Fowlpox virus isolate HP-438/Munich]AAF44444.1 ORF FPV100 RNA polymerase subunit, RPO30 [Fowlpox virus]AXY04542.1 RNA polymerase subunit [Fowlpox virus]
MDMMKIIKKYINSEEEAQKLLKWAIDNANIYYLRNIVNTKVNIEETKFKTVHNIGIEYSKDNKYKLSYRNKPSIATNEKYKELCNLIRSTNGIEKETLRYLLFGIKCVHAKVEYDIEKVPDYDYSNYFDVLKEKSTIRCVACKSNNTIPMILQTRSSDEEPTVRVVCKDCGKNFAPPRLKFN